MISLDGQYFSYGDIYAVQNSIEQVRLSSKTRAKVAKSRTLIEKIIEKKHRIYGVSTGFGAFKNKVINKNDLEKLQKNLLVSHAVGVGEPLDKNIVRGIMFLIANYLSKGYSGIRPEVVDALLGMVNNNVIPVVPEKGSVGSSGDLSPSSHIMLVLIGKGEAFYNGKRMRGSSALRNAGLEPVRLQAKEGLALINNTATMLSIGVHALQKASDLADIADAVSALSAQAFLATKSAFDERIHQLKPYPGQIKTAARIRSFLDGSTMLDLEKVQDPYSLRCIPQVHGAVREAMSYVEHIVNTEINAVTDNPAIFESPTGEIEVLSGGNFHGEHVAIAMDTLTIAVSELGNIADRRIASLLDPAFSNGLPAFLAQNGGLNSGLMIMQYTTAALASENKSLAHPASVDSIPTSANVEDFVSMGTIAARKARSVTENVEKILALELIAACQGIDFRLQQGSKLGNKSQNLYKLVRTQIPFFAKDTMYYPYIEKASELLKDRSFLKLVKDTN